MSLLDRSEASRKARMAAITPLETRIAAGPVALPARSARAMPLNTKHRLIPSLGINTYISMLMGAVLNGRNRPAAPHYPAPHSFRPHNSPVAPVIGFEFLCHDGVMFLPA